MSERQERFPRVNAMAREEGWGTVTDAALGILPEDVESQARVVARWAAARIEELETRLEITHCYRMDPETGETTRCELTEEERKTFPDAVDCRDATIALLDERIEELEAEVATARNDALEEAAHAVHQALVRNPRNDSARSLAKDAIRALKSTTQT